MNTHSGPISFGITADFRNTPPFDRSFAQVYRDELDMIAYADELGFDYVYLSEHHFVEDGYCPSLLAVAGAVLARTSKIRVNSYVFLLPLHHPLRVAEDVAVLDAMSGGRMELGVGMGYRPEEFAGFGIDRGRRRSLMDECCDVLMKAWTEPGAWSHHGEHFDLQDVDIYPKAVQLPHPKLWISARTAAAVRRALRLRAPLLLPPPAFIDDEKAVYEAYTSGLRELGEDPTDTTRFPVGGTMSCVVTDDPEAYRAKVRDAVRHRASMYGKWLATADDVAGDANRASQRVVPGRPPGVVGTADECIGAIEALVSSVVPYTHIVMHADGPEELEQFAKKVMPHFNA